MARIVLISCVSKKLSHRAKAKELYVSPFFKYNLRYARSLNPDKILVLSAEHGLVDLEKEIDPYNKTLNTMSSKDIKEWANNVINQLSKIADLKKDEIIFLAGERYRKCLIPYIDNYKIPLKGLRIGEQLKYLKRTFKMSEKCNKLHQWFNDLKQLNFPFNEEDIPLNGIYILFEKGEFAHDTNRIVRIGTHTGNNQLRSRLKQHFINENKDRSIFRKNIGRCLLKKDNDPFLEKWELDLTTKKAKEKYADLIDFNKQKEIEKGVTKFIQDNFSFVVFRVDNKEKRLELESKIISTVSLCNKCKASKKLVGTIFSKKKNP